MIDFILNALVYILAIYGLIEIIKTIFYIMEFTNLNENRSICNNWSKEWRKESKRNNALYTI